MKTYYELFASFIAQSSSLFKNNQIKRLTQPLQHTQIKNVPKTSPSFVFETTSSLPSSLESNNFPNVSIEALNTSSSLLLSKTNASHNDNKKTNSKKGKSESKGFKTNTRCKKEHLEVNHMTEDLDYTLHTKKGTKTRSGSISSYSEDGHSSVESINESKIKNAEKLAKLKGQRLILRTFDNNSDAVASIFENSSDSDDALEPFADTKCYSNLKRREAHRQDLIAIAKQAFPPDDEMRKLYNEAVMLRESDRQSGRRFDYSNDTIERYTAIGQHAKKTTPMHNSLLRKAYKKAIEPSKSQYSNITEYESLQGTIRTELLGVIQNDALKLNWKQHDFLDQDTKIWKVVDFLQKEVLSGDANKPKIASVIDERDSLEGCTPFASWHHIAFKAAKDTNGHKFVEVYALRPDGLMLAHDTRAQNDGSVAKKDYGDHEWIHQATSCSKKDRFGKMDELAVNIVLEQTAVPRTTKREAYSLNILERLENFSKHVEPHNMQAKALYEKITEIRSSGAAYDLEKFVSRCLKDSDWGEKLLKQQSIMDERTHVARLESSRSSNSENRSMDLN